MKRKRYILILKLSIIFVLANIIDIQVTNATDFQRIEISISEIKWEKTEEYESFFENKFVIKITTSLIINNPNNHSLILRHPTYPIQTYGTKTEITLSNKKLETEFMCICGSMAQMVAQGSIPAGLSTNKSISYLFIEENGLEDLPDGRYVFWNYIYAY